VPVSVVPVLAAPGLGSVLYVGGAVLLGLRKLVVVPHGSFEAAGITNAIRLAARSVSERAVERTADLLASTGTTRAALRDRKAP